MIPTYLMNETRVCRYFYTQNERKKAMKKKYYVRQWHGNELICDSEIGFFGNVTLKKSGRTKSKTQKCTITQMAQT